MSSHWPSNFSDLDELTKHTLFDKILPFYKSILLEEKIPENESLIETLDKLYIPFCSWLCKKQKNKPLIIGLNGAQGSGKSTLTKIIKLILETAFNKNVVSLSIDDLYKTRQQRHILSQQVHPLLFTRGVPGTHDIELARSILKQLKQGNDTELLIPVFDKAIDDRMEKPKWKKITKTCDIVIFEGWCVGSTSQQDIDLLTPVNELERTEDEKGIWRTYVNKKLSSEYKNLFSLIDILVMLKIPNFEKVFEWRGLQEKKLIDSISNAPENKHLTMDEKQIKRFVMHYERISRHTLDEMSDRADIVFCLGDDHLIKQVNTRNLT